MPYKRIINLIYFACCLFIMDTGTQHEVQHVLKLKLLFHSYKNHKNVISTMMNTLF